MKKHILCLALFGLFLVITGCQESHSKLQDAETYYNRGLAKAKLGQYEEAIKDCNKAIELDPSYAMAYPLRGAAKAELKQYEEAVKDFNKAIELDPSNRLAIEGKRMVEQDLQALD